MPLLMATISGLFLRPDLGAGAMTVHIKAAADGTRLTYSGAVVAGSYKVRIGSDGSASVTIPQIPQAGLLPSDARWKLVMDVGNQRYTKEFTLAGNITWDSLVDVSGTPVSSSIAAAALASAAAAAASATAASASASAAAASAASASAIADSTGGYVHAFGNSNGTDDTTAINAVLAASPRFLRMTPGQTYKISGPLICRSNLDWNAEGCTIQHVAGYAGNTINNQAVSTVQRAISVSITAGSKNFSVTSGTLTTADNIREIVIPGAGANSGQFGLTARMTFLTSTTGTLDAAAGATVAGVSSNVYDVDVNIKLRLGTVDRGNNNGGSGIAQHSIFLRHIENFDIDIDRFVSTGTGPKYAINPGACRSGRIRVRNFSHVSDGIHIRGPASKLEIYGTMGTTTDDFVVLGSGDNSGGGIRIPEGAGDISDVQIYALTPVNLTTNHFKAYGVPGTKISGVRLHGVSGANGGKACAIGATDVTGATFDDFTVGDITSDHPTPVLVNGSGTNLRIRDITSTDSTVTDVVSVVSVIAGQTWDKISIRGLHAPNIASTAAGGSMVQINGTVTTLVLDDAKFSAPTSGCCVLLNNAASSVSRLYLSNIEQLNGGSPVKAATSTHVLSEVWYDNVYVNGAAFIGDFATTTIVHLAGVSSASLANNTFNARATANLKFYGEGNTLTGTLAVAAGAIVSAYSADIPFSATAGAVPTVAAGAGAGTGATASIVGNERIGTVTVTCGTGTAAGVLVTVTLMHALGAAPREVLLTGSGSNGGRAAAAQIYASSKTTTTFVVSAQAAPTASQALAFDYQLAA